MVEVAVFTNLVPVGAKENRHFSMDKRSKTLTVKTGDVQGNFLSSTPAPDDPFGDAPEQVTDVHALGAGSQWKVRARNPIMRSGELEWYVLIPA